jgi:hypothetical protein
MSSLATQSITVKILPVTNTKPTRYKAFCQRGSIIASFSGGESHEENATMATRLLLEKFMIEDKNKYGSRFDSNPWRGPWICGINEKGDYVFVNHNKKLVYTRIDTIGGKFLNELE